MDTYNEQRLRVIFKTSKEVEVTVVNFETGKDTEYSYSSFDEAIHGISELEYEHDVYF